MTKPTPKGTTVNEIIESAFTQYARLEASCDDSKEGEAEAVGHPPAPTTKRRAPQAVRRKLCTGTPDGLPGYQGTPAGLPCCAGNKSGCCSTTAQPTTTANDTADSDDDNAADDDS